MDKIKCKGKKALTQLVRNQSGQGVLAIVLILTFLGTLILGTLLGFMATGLKVGQMHESKAQELYAADSGVEDALNWLIHGKQLDGNWGWTWNGTAGQRASYNISDGTVIYTVNVSAEALAEEDTYKVTSVATGPRGRTQVFSTVYAIHWIQVQGLDQGTYYGDYNVTEPLTLEQSTTVRIVGDLFVNGDLTLRNKSALQVGNSTVEGNIVIGNQGTITGDVICLTGNITASNPASMTTDIHFLGPNCTITLDNNSKTNKFTGNILAEGNLTIQLSNSAVFVGNVYAPNGNVTIYLNHPQTSMNGDKVYASGSIVIAKNKSQDPPPEIHQYYTGDPPFEVADCPGLSVKAPGIVTYQVS